MHRKNKLVLIVIALISVFFGVREDVLISIVDWVDPPPAGQARVEEVVDGDTILVRFGGNKERVRLIGVDTPETHHPEKAVQCYGQAATDYLQMKLDGEDVRLEADSTNTNRDRYDRLLRYVYLDEELVNESIIRDGYGFAYTLFPFQKIDDFKLAQEHAATNNLGLWEACDVSTDGDTLNSGPDLDASQ